MSYPICMVEHKMFTCGTRTAVYMVMCKRQMEAGMKSTRSTKTGNKLQIVRLLAICGIVFRHIFLFCLYFLGRGHGHYWYHSFPKKKKRNE